MIAGKVCLWFNIPLTNLSVIPNAARDSGRTRQIYLLCPARPAVAVGYRQSAESNGLTVGLAIAAFQPS